MLATTKSYYDHRGPVLVKNLQSRHFDAYYCSTKAEALEKALELIPKGSTIGWGGCMSAEQIGLIEAVKAGEYTCIDRSTGKTAEEVNALMKKCLTADVFITGANGISMDGQMVNIDGNGNRASAIIFGPDSVIVIAGMNKVCDTVEAAFTRAKTVAAPVNNQRFDNENPCKFTGTCAQCKSVTCICNHYVVTRHCRPVGRIKFILVGEDLGF